MIVLSNPKLAEEFYGPRSRDFFPHNFPQPVLLKLRFNSDAESGDMGLAFNEDVASWKKMRSLFLKSLRSEFQQYAIESVTENMNSTLRDLPDKVKSEISS